MLQLLQPAWMWLSAAIVIPVAIHLWNIRKGKVLQVGSIALLHESTAKRTMNVRLTELLLLLLRCLLILSLALMLAKPQWIKPFDSNKKGWVLIDKSDMRQTYQQFKFSIDSLLKDGYELHDFNTGFTKLNLKDSAASPLTPLLAERGTNREITETKNYWQLIEALNKTIPAAMPVYIFSDNGLKHFAGNKPVINLNLHWKTYAANDSTETIAEAYKINNDSVRIVTNISKPTANFYTYEDYAVNALPPKYASLHIDTSALHVTVYDKFSTDAKYITAAIETVQQFTKRNIKITTAHTPQQIPQQQDWLFWLSDETVNKNFKADNIFMYATGKETDKNSWVATSANNNANIILYKRIIAKEDISSMQLLSDGFGEPLLTVEEQQNKKIYQFYSRFNLQWNNLVASEYFPQLMLQLLLDKKKETVIADNRMMDTLQLQPAFSNTNDIQATGKKTVTANLFYYVWVIVFLLFCAERFMSLKTVSSRQYA